MQEPNHTADLLAHISPRHNVATVSLFVYFCPRNMASHCSQSTDYYVAWIIQDPISQRRERNISLLQTRPGTHPTSYSMGSFARVKETVARS